LHLSISKLHEIRAHTPDAAGLVVAHSIEHAHRIKRILEQTFNQTVQLVSYREKNPQEIIEQFRHGKMQWIVSIGMISEGTDIPRLHVCCHITTIRTELYFRQVLGRVLRVRAADNSSEGFLFTFAEPQLKSFACRVQNELPLLDVLRKSKPSCKPGQGVDEKSEPSSSTNIQNESSLTIGEQAYVPTVSGTAKEKADLRWSFRGIFREEIIRALSQI
jgi:superfamily II DNA or RNA helicase